MDNVCEMAKVIDTLYSSEESGKPNRIYVCSGDADKLMEVKGLIVTCCGYIQPENVALCKKGNISKQD